ncbi:glucose-6-phosphate isomerase 1, chloroplastic-like isoform X1 [Eucalyptus grandis]|uniref:glucose-6-phosphate isomerase 1, chloroplastic-like isoform X1 n=1 Tax=Eucalyptus grandis TaxID=71139 RepID=UPI00192E9675|nr:glucose-6-phosphate isomerase 1, chloroplastic-like isoform X1 [Eucalyptus grandis]
MSAVGRLPAALQGINIREMLAGASFMDGTTRTKVVKNNPAALLALCWYWASDGVGSKDMVILPYKDSLLLFSWYLQQFDLDGNRVNQGLTVYGNTGSTDQHAYKQQLREGVHNFFVTFIEVLCERPPGHDWELEPSVSCGDYLFGMLQFKIPDFSWKGDMSSVDDLLIVTEARYLTRTSLSKMETISS